MAAKPQLLGCIVLFILNFLFTAIHCGNLTEEKAAGVDIVEAVVFRIYDSGIFSNDHFFLLRLAYVETDFGMDKNKTFPENYFGGIWRVDEDKFRKTQDISIDILRFLHKEIYTHFNITWQGLHWNDLLKPLHCGLAAKMYLEVVAARNNGTGQPITSSSSEPPITIRRQAYYWTKYYRPESYFSTTKFIERAYRYHDNWAKCSPRIDIVVAVDTSASFKFPGPRYPDLLSNYVPSLLEQTFDFVENKYPRIGMFVFSNQPYHIADVNNDYSLDRLMTIAAQTQLYLPGGDTRIDLALIYGTQMLKNATRLNDGVPQVILMFTDGEASEDVKKGADYASKEGVETILIAIGNETDSATLNKIVNNRTENVYKVTRLEALPDLFYEVRCGICRLPQKPIMPGEDNKYVDTLRMGDVRNFVLVIHNLEGITVTVKVLNAEGGNVTAFWSYWDRVPCQHVHNGRMGGSGVVHIPHRFVNGTGGRDIDKGTKLGQIGYPNQVYFAVHAHNGTIYELSTEQGDTESHGEPCNRISLSSMKYAVSLILFMKALS